MTHSPPVGRELRHLRIKPFIPVEPIAATTGDYTCVQLLAHLHPAPQGAVGFQQVELLQTESVSFAAIVHGRFRFVNQFHISLPPFLAEMVTFGALPPAGLDHLELGKESMAAVIHHRPDANSRPTLNLALSGPPDADASRLRAA